MTQVWDAALYESRHAFVWQAGSSLVDLLDPKLNEFILDLGCGTGQLTAAIAQRGARVLGFDSSPEMIQAARANFPEILFTVQDATVYISPEPADAVFSNAALHWVMEPAAAVACMRASLRRGGRLVLEMGGHGNIATIMAAIRHAFHALGLDPNAVPPFLYFPTIAQYTTVLESAGFEIRNALLFDRPTPLDGGRAGLRNWITQFKTPFLAQVPSGKVDQFFSLAEQHAAPTLATPEGWFADYRRLRIQAVAV
jgi:trans-aconitate 2-methyltransferase